ncbi:DUF6415 family natural product biosynthesis protein [Streptomyces capitiformicae]|uniref:Uncharacterized protein n=1 Tax=Streptomyces capitiformicae TaxID=2014920 RepID=A0A919DKZ3_9ACTN|nr:DUF6415 family natural product biosynthesis protein [Streptomyces capitiformicae]GHE58532.1 hypothetical protein GCM10017771_81530 [Streptomyces capitiformicae]
MSDNQRTPLDAQTIRESYETGFDVWGVNLVKGASGLAELRLLLTGHLQLLVPEVTDVVARMRGFTRSVGIHCLAQAHQILDDAKERSPAEERFLVHDLAVNARALLALYEMPGPRGMPVGREEIEQTVRRKGCGACSRPIKKGEPQKRAYLPGRPASALKGSLHTDNCDTLASANTRHRQPHTAS